MTAITFKFSIDQRVYTPHGEGIIEGLGLFWQPDGAERIFYLVDTGRDRRWFEEKSLRAPGAERVQIVQPEQTVMAL
jgi:hypothetical protein